MRVYFQYISQISHQLMKNLNLVYKINATEGMKFSKNGCNGGGGVFSWNWRKAGFGRNGKFLKSFFFHCWQRMLTLLFYEDPPSYIANPPHPLFKFCPHLPQPHFPVTSFPPPPLLFLLPFLFGWMGNHATSDVLFYLMIIWIYTCQALVP